MGNRRKPRNSRSKSWEDKESRDMRRDNKEDLKRKSTNDPAWYAADPALLRDATSLPFSWPLGRPAPIGVDDGGNIMNWAQAGICSLNIVPAIGEATNISSPINVAAQSMYSFIRHANSGSKNYDAPDLMIYCIAMSEVYSALNWAMRLYGYATTWNQKNRFTPRQLISANAVDPDSIINNLANFRMRLNVYINKISGMAVPANMSIFARKAFLYQNVYCESLDIKDQLYQFIPDGFYKFALDAQSRGYLDYVPIVRSPKMTYSDVLNYIDTLFQAVWDQEDFGIMSGDVLRAYGDNIIKLASVDENYAVLPVYDRLVNLQFKNATIVQMPTAPNIIQDPNTYAFLEYDANGRMFPGHPLQDPGATAAYYDKILTIDSEVPTPEEIIEATRLMVTYDQMLNDNNTDHMDLYCGTEIVNRAYYTFMAYDGSFVEQSVSTNWFANGVSPIFSVWAITQFKYWPVTYIWNGTGTIASGSYLLPSGAGVRTLSNIDNFAMYRNQDIRKVHEAAILNMLNVPSIAKNAISQR